MTTETQDVEELTEIRQRVNALADELDVTMEHALELLQVQQNQKIINQLKEIEIHTNNIVRQS